MHCELVVPGLFAAPSAERLPAAELLIARGRCSGGASRGLEEWLHDAFALDDAPLAAGALTLLAGGGEPAGDSWSRADPVHLRLMRDRLVLVPAAALRVTSGEAEAFCDALNRHFGERLRLQVIDAERWVARLTTDLALGAAPPLALAGRDVALTMPANSTAHQLLNEAQMVLHSHPVNEAREARGEPAINSIWLWGAGRLASLEAPRWQSVSAAEPLALGLARAAGVRHRALPASGAAWLDRMPEEGRHLVVLDALRAPLALSETADYHQALARLERDWFAPLLTALRDARVGMVTIHVPDAGECVAYETIRGDLRRFWRRPKALEHYA
ncbi:MAG TPA: regulator [Burkholderiales bacterium]|nr:regulator [Burkholderiales bacterium]